MKKLSFDLIFYILSFNQNICPSNHDLKNYILSKYFYIKYKSLKDNCKFGRFIGLKYCKTHFGHLINNKSFLIL